jgi:hypothetical protein
MSRCTALRLRTGVAISSAAALAACVASSLPPPQPPRAPPSDKTDASYDWRSLVIAPFGTRLQEIPIGLHEALLFQDAHGRDAKEDGDCYAIDGEPPQFVGRRPDEYLLCFDHDRLNRIEAAVRLAPDGAGPVFAAACARWLANSAAPAATPPAGEPNGCEGRDGATGFRARLSGEAAQAPDVLSISLFSAADSAP